MTIDILLPGISLLKLVHHSFIRTGVQDNEPGTLDADIRLRINKPHTVDCRGSPLVKLSGKIFDCDVFPAFKVTGIHNLVGHHLAEHTVAALFKQFRSKAEQVIDIQETQCLQV